MEEKKFYERFAWEMEIKLGARNQRPNQMAWFKGENQSSEMCGICTLARAHSIW